MNIRIVLLILLACISGFAQAAQKSAIYYEYEQANFADGRHLGFEVTTRPGNAGLGFGALSRLGSITVIDNQGFEQSYSSFEVGAKFGYLGPISIYIEGAIDAFEILSLKERDGLLFDNRRSNNPDTYLALVVGVTIENLRLEAFVRNRRIDADFWFARDSQFSGVRMALTF